MRPYRTLLQICPVSTPEAVEQLRCVRNATRQFMQDTEYVTVKQQQAWWKKQHKLVRAYLVTLHEQVVGYLLVRWVHGRPIGTYALVAAARGRGHGKELCWTLNQWFPGIRFLIQNTNIPSQKAAQSVGFVPISRMRGPRGYTWYQAVDRDSPL